MVVLKMTSSSKTVLRLDVFHDYFLWLVVPSY